MLFSKDYTFRTTDVEALFLDVEECSQIVQNCWHDIQEFRGKEIIGFILLAVIGEALCGYLALF